MHARGSRYENFCSLPGFSKRRQQQAIDLHSRYRRGCYSYFCVPTSQRQRNMDCIWLWQGIPLYRGSQNYSCLGSSEKRSSTGISYPHGVLSSLVLLIKATKLLGTHGGSMRIYVTPAFVTLGNNPNTEAVY